MKKAMKKLTALLLSCVLIFSSATAMAKERNTNILANMLLEAMATMISETYKFGVDEVDLYKNALKEVIASDVNLTEIALEGMFRDLDKYSEYFDSTEFEKFLDSLNGEFSGIGVAIMEMEEGLLVTEVYKDSPAEGAGIKKGDIIVSAGETDIRGMSIEIAKTHIVGEEGTEVTVGVERNGKLLTFTMIRKKVEVIPGFYQILDGNIGYIQLASFDSNSGAFVKEALDFLKDTKNIILDLRSNPGGTVEALQAVAELTLPKGPVIHFEYKNEQNNTTVANEKNNRFKKKLVVITDGYTASAAEAFAAAVQDYKVGVIVGEQTLGKGTMQNVNGVLTGGGYKLTVAEYLSPLKRNINKIGVEPDFKAKPRTVTYSENYFQKVTYDRTLNVGDTGLDVLAYEQRLNLLGYSVGVPDRIFGEDTFYAVKKFQKDVGLHSYGVLDFTTQMNLENSLYGKKIVIDEALNKAVELASGDMDKYIKEAIEIRKITNR